MNGFSMKYEQIIEVKVFLKPKEKKKFPPVLIVKSDIVSTHKKKSCLTSAGRPVW